MSGGDRKIGRNKKRPAQKRYVAEKRSEKNKRRNIERHAKRMAAVTAKAARRKPDRLVA